MAPPPVSAARVAALRSYLGDLEWVRRFQARASEGLDP